MFLLQGGVQSEIRRLGGCPGSRGSFQGHRTGLRTVDQPCLPSGLHRRASVGTWALPAEPWGFRGHGHGHCLPGAVLSPPTPVHQLGADQAGRRLQRRVLAYCPAGKVRRGQRPLPQWTWEHRSLGEILVPGGGGSLYLRVCIQPAVCRGPASHINPGPWAAVGDSRAPGASHVPPCAPRGVGCLHGMKPESESRPGR